MTDRFHRNTHRGGRPRFTRLFLPPLAQPSVKADRDADSQHRYITSPLGKNSRQEVNDQNYGTQTDIVALEHMRERDCAKVH
jgi:hypothetical protein